MSRNCTKCGATVPDTAKFCRVCGTAITPKVSPSPQKCPTCNNMVPGGKRNCPKCGTRLPRPKPAPTTQETKTCPHCGYDKIPTTGNFCTKCGKTLSEAAPPEEEPVEPEASTTPVSEGVCPKCGKPIKPRAKFCTSCGSSLSNPSSSTASVVEKDTTPRVVSEIEESSFDPIPVPAKALSQLVARGKQLAIEKGYTGKQDGDEKIIKRLSEAEKDGGYPLEEIVDTYIRERTEHERLEELLESGEVADRVYSRLSKEYDEKLLDLEEKIKTGRDKLLGYLATLKRDLQKAEENLDGVEARIQSGDEKELKDKRKQLKKKIQKLSLAITAAVHILNKESAISGGTPIRFEISEKTLGEPIEEESEGSDGSSSTSSTAKPTADIEGGKICPKCGVVVSPQMKFCTKCGQKI